MEQERALPRKSMDFAKRIVRLYQYMLDQKHEFVLSKQLLRSGTSIGANIAESKYASSRKDFLNKLYIALKECGETVYWLELLHECDFLSVSEYRSIAADAEELLKLLTAITKTIKEE